MSDYRRLSVAEAVGDMSIRELDIHVDERIAKRLDSFAEKLQQQQEEQYRRLEELFKSGFPGGDPVQHRLAHEDMMRMVSARRRLYEELITHLAKGGIWAMMVFLAIAAWHWLKGHIQGG